MSAGLSSIPGDWWKKKNKTRARKGIARLVPTSWNIFLVYGIQICIIMHAWRAPHQTPSMIIIVLRRPWNTYKKRFTCGHFYSTHKTHPDPESSLSFMVWVCVFCVGSLFSQHISRDDTWWVYEGARTWPQLARQQCEMKTLMVMGEFDPRGDRGSCGIFDVI